MDSFERREAKLRAQEKWAVVRKSVLPEKDEFLEKANKGKSEEWLEHWNKRRKTQTKSLKNEKKTRQKSGQKT